MRFIHKVVSAADIIFDVGGHHGYSAIGYSAIILSKCVGDEGEVVVFDLGRYDS